MGSFLSSERFSKDHHPVPLLQHPTGARFGSDSTQSWIKSLPDCFLNSEEGVVGSLISFVSELFQLVTSALREAGHPQYADKLGLNQKRFALWRDKKDDIDKKLDGSRETRDAIVVQLWNLVLVLGSQGLSPSRCKKQLDLVKNIDQCLEQASKLISDDLGQVPYDSETHLINSFTEAISKIHMSITSLFELSKDIDLTTKEAFDRCFPASVQGTGPSFSELLSKHYPAASAKTIRRSSIANQERLQILLARLKVVNSRSGLICRANCFKGHHQVPSDHSNVQILDRSRSISDGSTASESGQIDDERPLTSSATSASVHRKNHSLPQKIDTDQSWVSSILHCPYCEASFKTQAALEEHILDLMKPYFCSFNECTSGLVFFDSPQECIDHEFEYHRIECNWTCTSCKVSFPHQKGLEDHLLQNHCIDATSAGWKGLLKKSRTYLPQQIEDEECNFCRTKSFSTREDFATHVGKHMEQISSLIVPSIIPQKSEISEEFTEPIEIWDYRNNKFMESCVKLDTAADDSFISRSAVEQYGIPTRKLENEKPSIRTANNVKIKVTEWAEPKWRAPRKNYRDTRLLILENIPGDEQMILGKDFLKVKTRVWHEALPLHNDGQGLSSEEQRRHEIQCLDDKANQETRKAAIKAKRDQLGKPAGQQSKPTAKDILPNGKEAVK